MVSSALFLLILAVNGVFAVYSDRVAHDRKKPGGVNRQPDSTVPTSLKTAEESDADSELSSRRLSEYDDVDSYVNDDLPHNDQLLYAVYDYDDGTNDKNVHVIDPRSLAASPVIDASEALLRKINGTTF